MFFNGTSGRVGEKGNKEGEELLHASTSTGDDPF